MAEYRARRHLAWLRDTGTQFVQQMIGALGDDPARPGLLETPVRVMKAWEHFTSGYNKDPLEVLKSFEDGADGCDEMVFQSKIPFFSTCEHHLVPFFGMVHIAYIPNGRVIGLSKLSRLVDIFARRLQVQERICVQVADALMMGLEPIGVGVVVQARHMCMEARGIEKVGTITTTTALRGAMKDHSDARAEFLQLVNTAILGVQTV